MTSLKPNERNVQRFQQWIATMTDDDFRQIAFRGKLNRKEISEACGFAKSVLQQNPKVKDLLESLEDDLRYRKILPELTEVAKRTKDLPVKYDQSSKYKVQSSERASKLELENLELKAKIKVLENQLQRYQELSEVMSDMGIMPR